MVALVVLVLILAILGGLGFAAHLLWYVLLASSQRETIEKVSVWAPEVPAASLAMKRAT
jgi:hypothetical protein